MNEGLVVKAKLAGVSKLGVGILRGLGFEVYDSKYSMIAKEKTDFITYRMNSNLLEEYRHNVNTDISTKWYIDQVKQYYRKKVKRDIENSSGSDAGYINNEIVRILDNTTFNGVNASDIVNRLLWGEMIGNRLSLDASMALKNGDYKVFSANNIIMGYLDKLKYSLSFIISYDEIIGGIRDCEKCIKRSVQNMLYSRNVYDIAIHSDKKRSINIEKVDESDIPVRDYIRNLEIYNKQGVSRINNCGINEIECSEGKVNVICYDYDRRYILEI